MTAVHSDDLDLLERLGGSEATVHRAVVRPTGRVVVVKRAVWDRPAVAARLGREAAVLRRVQHPSLVRLLHAHEDEQARTLVLAHAPGGSLQARIEAHGPVPAVDVADLGARLAHALAALHRHGVVHRDVHPGNVLIDAELQPVLADLDHALDQQAGHLPSDDEVVGHPAHVDPRLFTGHPAGPSNDLHALATTLWTAATGTPPHRTGPTERVVLPADDRVPAALREVLDASLRGELDAVGMAGNLQAAATELQSPTGPSPAPSAPMGSAPSPLAALPPPSPDRTGGAPRPALVAGTGDAGTRRWGPPPRGGGAPAALGGTAGRRPWALVLAGLGVLVLATAGWLLAGRAGDDAATTRAAVPPPTCGQDDAAGAGPGTTDGVLADLDGDGCSEVLWMVDGVLHAPSGAYHVGRPDDVLVAGDWDGDGTWGVGLYRPTTGAVFLFDDAPGPGVRSRRATRLAAGGVPVVIDDGVRHRVTLTAEA